MTEPLAIHARDLRFTYTGRPAPAIRDVSVRLEPGECLLVIGPSGSGKSTFALALAGLVPNEIPGEMAGELRIGELELGTATRREAAALIGILFQDPATQLVMDRAGDDVAFGLESRGWTIDAMLRRVPESLAAHGLAGFERRRSTKLSGGEQQRLAFAGVLAPRPGVLILDEPTANLDPRGTAAFFAGLENVRSERSQTVVLIEHRVDRAWPLADRILALGPDGAPLDLGTPDEVLARSGRVLAAAGIWLPEAGHRGSSSEGRDRVSPAPFERRGSGAALVQAQGLRYGYERGPHAEPVVRGVDLDLHAGERVALVGSNGSGKSTLARLLVGLLRPDRGSVRIGNIDPSRIAPARLARMAGYVFQEPERQFLATRVDEEIALGLTTAEYDAASGLMEALRLPLDSFAERSPYQLSGGEQRRLSLACALVRDPAFLVLDEPTFGQDRRGYEGLLDIIDQRVAAGTAVLAATHDERFIEDFAGRQVVMEDGWVIGHERIATHERVAEPEGFAEPDGFAEPEPVPARRRSRAGRSSR